MTAWMQLEQFALSAHSAPDVVFKLVEVAAKKVIAGA
jgi:hypothetical protein